MPSALSLRTENVGTRSKNFVTFVDDGAARCYGGVARQVRPDGLGSGMISFIALSMMVPTLLICNNADWGNRPHRRRLRAYRGAGGTVLFQEAIGARG